ncbi:hypothetical protein C8R47DRAFT_1312985 [Mycena vitilis]|nr:hypothetical protein C8R47DRAFT_1312985 [Mycena vitilis]
MPPLTRQRTLESIHSYWSDNGFVGATVSIHAMAKPLMGLMYHSQAKAFIERNRDTPISKEDLYIYFGYLEFKYVYGKTKAMILHDLYNRVFDADDAQIVAEHLATDTLLVHELLGSSHSGIRGWACLVLGNLYRHTSSLNPGAIPSGWLIERITELLSDPDINVKQNSVYSLCFIALGAAGKQAVLNAGALGYLPQLLDSADPKTRSFTLYLIEQLAKQESAAMEILQFIPCDRLMGFCDVGRPEFQNAVRVLGTLSKWAEAVLAAGALQYVPGLLDSADKSARVQTCAMLAEFALILIPPLAGPGLLLLPAILRDLTSLLEYFCRKSHKMSFMPSAHSLAGAEERGAPVEAIVVLDGVRKG